MYKVVLSFSIIGTSFFFEVRRVWSAGGGIEERTWIGVVRMCSDEKATRRRCMFSEGKETCRE